jgi:branched-chain amino acid aminotransferase
MKLVSGRIQLAELHMERLFLSLDLLQFQRPAYFTPGWLQEQVLMLAKKNGHEKLARIRLTIFRGEGGLYDVTDHSPNHLIQTWELAPANNILNENGLVVDIYKEARKACDHFSHLKSNNYLSYAMAALWAKRQHLNDAIILNAYDRVADATIANVFVVTNGVIKTPLLTEGAVSGVMRTHLLASLRKENFPVEETSLTPADLSGASELFLTNAIYGIRWVKALGENGYTNQVSSLLHAKFIQPLF